MPNSFSHREGGSISVRKLVRLQREVKVPAMPVDVSFWLRCQDAETHYCFEHLNLVFGSAC